MQADSAGATRQVTRCSQRQLRHFRPHLLRGPAHELEDVVQLRSLVVACRRHSNNTRVSGHTVAGVSRACTAMAATQSLSTATRTRVVTGPASRPPSPPPASLRLEQRSARRTPCSTQANRCVLGSPGKSGLRVSSSAKMQPTLQLSTAGPYCSAPSSSSGGLHQHSTPPPCINTRTPHPGLPTRTNNNCAVS